MNGQPLAVEANSVCKRPLMSCTVVGNPLVWYCQSVTALETSGAER